MNTQELRKRITDKLVESDGRQDRENIDICELLELLDTIDRLTEELSHAELAATAEAQESDRRKAALIAVTAEQDALLAENEQLSDLWSQMKAKRDAWKEIAEHQYGLLRVELYGPGDADYPVKGALDAWAAGRYLILKE